MKIGKLILLAMLTFSILHAKDTTRVLSIPYSFQTGGIIQDTDASFLSYADEYKNTASLAEAIVSIFKASDKELPSMLSCDKDVELAKKFLAEIGEYSPENFKYVVFDGDNMLAISENPKAYMLINKEGKWEASKSSALYQFLANNADKAEFLDETPKTSKKIELYTADLNFVDTKKDEKALSDSEIFFYYAELFDAFFRKDFDTFRTFLDGESTLSLDNKTDGATDAGDIANMLGDELKEKREYRNIANLGDIYLIFFDSYMPNKEGAVLSVGIVRDISCGVELMGYGLELDPTLQDFISR